LPIVFFKTLGVPPIDSLNSLLATNGSLDEVNLLVLVIDEFPLLFPNILYITSFYLDNVSAFDPIALFIVF
jgi:hypothetical protein